MQGRAADKFSLVIWLSEAATKPENQKMYAKNAVSASQVDCGYPAFAAFLTMRSANEMLFF